MKWLRETPLWVWGIALAYASLPLLAFALNLFFAPGDVAPTGLLRPDSAIFVHSMQMFETGFYSPYATCQSPFGSYSQLLFPTPFHWMYGLVGAIGALLRLDTFVMLSLANGAGALLYVLAIFHFLRTVVPRNANLAFGVYSLIGGLGGPIYAVAAAAGVTGNASFADYFYRFAIYDVVEGSNLAPYLLTPRLYYTLPLALGFAGLTTFIVARRIQCPYHLAYSWLMLFTSSYLNIRFGTSFWALYVIYAWQYSQRPSRDVFLAGVPLAAGMVASVVFMMRSPTFFANTGAVVQQAMWLSSFVSASFPLLLLAAYVTLKDVRLLHGTLRTVAYGGSGFLASFSFMFVAHQFYYGSLLSGSDHAAAVAISDFALVGAFVAILISMRREKPQHVMPEHAWCIVWMLVFISLAISAFGGGWFLRFSPQRLMIFLGLPLSVLAAVALSRLREDRPILLWASAGLLLICGFGSLIVSTLEFQGPYGMHPGIASDLGMKYSYIPKDDAECLAKLNGGVVAAPAPYNDILSLRNGVEVLGGFGAADLSDKPSATLNIAVDRFFGTDVSLPERTVFLEQFCVKYVFLPSAHAVLWREFDEMEELELVAQVGEARLYAVP